MRIGVDVGGTNTDAVLMNGTQVLASTKTPTTPNVSGGITTALHTLVSDSGLDVARLDAVMIGTTHFTNAVAPTLPPITRCSPLPLARPTPCVARPF